jgi:hypothetical protein
MCSFGRTNTDAFDGVDAVEQHLSTNLHDNADHQPDAESE